MGLAVRYESDCQNTVEIHTVCVPHTRAYTRIKRARSLSVSVCLSVSLSVACLFLEMVKITKKIK